MNSDLLSHAMESLEHPTLRDLAAVCFAPPLLVASPQQRHPLAASIWWQEPQRILDWLLALQWQGIDVPVLPSGRLGLYYERLWHYVLHCAPDIDVLAHNLQVRYERQTAGELDLLYRDAEGLQHLELAIKFYLGLQQHWIGPGNHDRLDKKVQHFLTQQLPMGQQLAHTKLANEITELPHSAFWMGGYLFAPKDDAAPTNTQLTLNPKRAQGLWLRNEEWPTYWAQSSADHWQALPRTQWLAPSLLQPSQCWSGEEQQRWLEERQLDPRARLVVLYRRNHRGALEEQERLFIAPALWPAQAQTAKDFDGEHRPHALY